MSPSRQPPSPESGDSDSGNERPIKRQRLDSGDVENFEERAVKIFIISAKLQPEQFASLVAQVEQNTPKLTIELCSDVGDADVIITAIRMKRRFLRHVDWHIAKHKAIVTPAWLTDTLELGTIQSCGEYAAISEFKDETVDNCPHNECADCAEEDAEVPLESPDENEELPVKLEIFPPTPELSITKHTSSGRDIPDISFKATSACLRYTPLSCPNQSLVDQLAVIRDSRDLEAEERSALSYARAISVLKAFPRSVTFSNLHNEAAKLPGVGQKLVSLIEDYLQTGEIVEFKEIYNSSRFHILKELSSIYGIGPGTARRLLAQGVRSIDDLREYYEQQEQVKQEDSKKEHAMSNVPLSVLSAIALKDDLAEKIPREEVEEIHAIVKRELDEMVKGTQSIVAGGYRRGKSFSNDVDIVITHASLSLARGQGAMSLCDRAIERLRSKGIVTHVMHLSGFHAPNPLRTAQFDSLQKALTVFVPPAKANKERRTCRRVDLIFAAPEIYWCAVVGWTGSKTFERDLRRWARFKGLKFDSTGIVRRRDSHQYFPKSEEEVFEILSLPCIDPTLRNCD